MIKWEIVRDITDKSTEYLYDSYNYGSVKQSHISREKLIENTVILCCEMIEKNLTSSEIKNFFGIDNE